MIWHNHLFCCRDVAPFLVAAGGPSKYESMTAENCDHLASGQPRRSAVTQPSPRLISRSAASRFYRGKGRVELLPRCRASLPLPSRPLRCTLAARDRLRSSFRLPSRTPKPHGTSCLQYSAKSVRVLPYTFRPTVDNFVVSHGHRWPQLAMKVGSRGAVCCGYPRAGTEAVQQ